MCFRSVAPSSWKPTELATPPELLERPTDRLLWQLDQLPKLAGRAGVKGRRTAFSIPAGQTLCKHLQLGRAESPVELADEAARALSEQAGLEPGQMICRVEQVQGSERGSKLESICVATSRAFVVRLMQAMKAARLKPVAAHSELHALWHAGSSLVRDENDRPYESPTMLIDIGAGRTNVIVATPGELLFARSVESDGETPDDALCDEIALCARYQSSIGAQRTPERAALVGEAANGSIAEALGRTLEVPVVMGAPWTPKGPRVDRPLAWAVALGLCLGPTDL
ncbi:MAG: hypothetical protein AAFU70_12455 [Planctomycetota bacterium]